MPYEAFANALAQITGNYARQKTEERMHARDRAERQADTADQRSYEGQVRKENEAASVRLAQKQADISFDEKLKELTKLEPERAHQALLLAARSLGIDNADALSASELYARISAAKNKEAATAIITEALARAEAKNQVEDAARNDPNLPADIAKDRANFLLANKPQIEAMQTDLASAKAELEKIRAADPKLAAAPVTLDQLAQQKAQEFIQSLESLPPAQRDAQLVAAASSLPNAKTPALARAAILSNPVGWAMGSMRVTQKDVDAANAIVSANLRAAGYADRPDVQALVQRINHYSTTLAGMGVNPGPANFFSPPSTAPSPGVPAVPAATSSAAPKLALPGAAVMGGAGGNWGGPAPVPATAAPAGPISAAPPTLAPTPESYATSGPLSLYSPIFDGALNKVSNFMRNPPTPSWAHDQPAAPAPSSSLFWNR